MKVTVRSFGIRLVALNRGYNALRDQRRAQQRLVRLQAARADRPAG